eukprot:4120355-Prymnesium_polylepis.1
MSVRCLIQRSSRRPDRVQDDLRANRSAHSSARAHDLCNVVQVTTPPPWSSCRTTVTAAAVKTSSHVVCSA